DDVVAFLVRDVAEDRLEHAAALVHEDDLVALAVPEEIVHRSGRATERDLDVRVPHQQAPPADLVALGLDVERRKMAVRVLVGYPPREVDWRERAVVPYAARPLLAVEDRLVTVEALEPYHLVGKQRSVNEKLNVTLAKYVA